MTRNMTSFAAFLFGVFVAWFLRWTGGGRKELDWRDEQRLRDDLAYKLARFMTWEMAKWVAARVPKGWL